jgi:hypothetical protein
MRRLLQPGLLALLVLALAAVPALAGSWRGDQDAAQNLGQNPGNQGREFATSQAQTTTTVPAQPADRGVAASGLSSESLSSDGMGTQGSSGYRAERNFDRGRGLRVIGLTDGGRLVTFRSTSPSRIATIGRISGLAGDRSLVGIDYRVQDGKLYGVGDRGGIYTISTRTAKVVKVSQLTVALDGRSFGVDFNPAANRLRVVSDTGQNLRHNIDDPAGAPAAGTTAMDAMLTYPPATVAATGVTAVAYTNNDLDPNTATTLFDLDSNLDQTAVQSPANAGTLAATGKLGVDSDPGAGFDIYSGPRDRTASSATGLATLRVNGRYGLYQIGLLTGGAGFAGQFPARQQVVDLAIPFDQG